MTYPTTTRILALDLATITGHALLSAGVVTSGSQSFARKPPTKTRAAAHIGESHAMFANWLALQLSGPRIDALVYEDAGFFKSAAAVQICVGFRGVLLARAAREGIPIYSYGPSTVKKFWAKTGGADKDMMRAALLLNLPGYEPEPVDDNEVDSLALLHLHLSSTKPT